MSEAVRNVLSARQIADLIGVSESSVKRWVDSGEIAAIKTSGGHRRITVPAAIAFLRARGITPRQAGLLGLRSNPEPGPLNADATESFLEALTRDDAPKAQAILQGRYIAGASVAGLADQLVQPALEHLGKRWRMNSDGVLLEHRAVQTCAAIASEIAGWIALPRSTAPVVITCGPPDDPYMLAPFFATLTLIEAGCNAVHLGPNTPLATLALATARYSASACVISVSSRRSRRERSDWVRLGSGFNRSGVICVVGGRSVDTLPREFLDRSHRGGSMVELGAIARDLAASHRRRGPRRLPDLQTGATPAVS